MRKVNTEFLNEMSHLMNIVNQLEVYSKQDSDIYNFIDLILDYDSTNFKQKVASNLRRAFLTLENYNEISLENILDFIINYHISNTKMFSISIKNPGCIISDTKDSKVKSSIKDLIQAATINAGLDNE